LAIYKDISIAIIIWKYLFPETVNLDNSNKKEKIADKKTVAASQCNNASDELS
jgi:hypothetical protein